MSDERLSPEERVIGIFCTKCGVRKKAHFFDDHPSKRNGKQSQCKECQKATSREAYRRKKERLARDAERKRVQSILLDTPVD